MCHKPIPSDPYERIAPRERCLPGLVMSSNRISLPRTAPRALPVDPMGRVLLLQIINPTRPDARRSGARSAADATTARPRSTRRCANSSKRPGIHVAAEHLIGPPQTETNPLRVEPVRRDPGAELPRGRHRRCQGVPVGLDQIEQATTLGHRWWTAPYLLTSGQAALEDVVPNIDAPWQL
jgi:hypothetical protein